MMNTLVFALFLYPFFLPHGDLHLRIEEVTQAIDQYPDSLQLYLTRGELYNQHEQFDLARADFSFCLEHGFAPSRVYEGLSKSIGNLASPDSALAYIDLALEKDPGSFSSMEWKAHILYVLKKYCESAQLYETIIGTATDPSPSLFIDAANAWEACPNPEARHHAIEILQTGIHRIGPLHELYRELVHHYLTTQDYDEAITSQTYLVEHAVHPIMPLMERAWIYEKAGDPGSAKADLHQALNLLNDLPPSKSGLPAMMKLRDDIMAGLTRLPK